MIINYEKGKFGTEDRIITITSDGVNEWFSIFKLALLTNQMAINELNINYDKIHHTNRFFFQEAIEEAISMARHGIDWGQEKNKKKIIEWCDHYHLKFEKIEPQLRKIWQTKIEDFSNESSN